MFKLSELLSFDDIVIQCHDFPDADSLGSAFALFSYLRENGKNTKIIYSGKSVITKSNLLKMIDLLDIPIEFVEKMPPIKVLLMVDCQYGEGNVTKFEAQRIYQIDHHSDSENGYPGEIMSNLGSCSTLVSFLLQNEGFSIPQKVSTALYYGLYTDTSGFEEIAHPLDKDMRDSLFFDSNCINILRNNNLSIDELHIAGQALTNYRIDKKNKFAVFKAEQCDQNILGFISDLALQVENINFCIVYNELPAGYKLSVRSCCREVMANDLAAFVAFGGGHKRKAGGYIPMSKIGDKTIDDYIYGLAELYFESYDSVYSDAHNLDISAMSKYIKLKIPVGFVLSSKIFAAGTPMLIRTLEGDSDCISGDDIILMIGAEGEVYPITQEKFLKTYALTNDEITYDYSYIPTVKNAVTGHSIRLSDHALSCVPTGQTFIYAQELNKHCKVFTRWNTDGYMSGSPGDYIAVRADDHNDVYIIKREIFHKTYALVD